MTEKRYFEREWEGEYYIFDSYTISEKEFDEKVEYEDYQAFADSMTGDTVVNRLNELNDENKQSKMMIATLRNIVLENEDLEKENKELKKQLTLAKPLYSRRELEKENKELKQFKEKVFDWINGEIDSTKESHNVLLTGDEAEAIMEVLIRFKKELSE